MTPGPSDEPSHPLVERTAAHIREKMAGDSSGHDWWHIHRVWRMARRLAIEEQADLVVVELAALLHDIADWKFHNGDLGEGPRQARAWLESQGADPEVTTAVVQIVERVSFKGAGVADEMPWLEGRIVQDADRLDAIGAVGIGRAFAYGGHAGRLMFDPDQPPERHDSADAYRTRSGPTINHFYEKLLLLKDRMHTPAAKRIAAERHELMERFLGQFFREWNGEA